MGSVVKRITRPIRKIAKKIIPKEVKPFLPYIAAFYGGPAMAAKFGTQGIMGNAFLRNAVAKGLVSGATAAATDEDANILRTAALAATPDLISGGLGTAGRALGNVNPESKLAQFLVSKGTGLEATLNNPGIMDTAKIVGAQTSVDQSAKFAELNEQSIADYNASLLSGGMEDKVARRDAIYKIFLKNGYEEERINTMLDTYGYAQGGIAGLRSGYDEGGTVTITQKEYDRLTKDMNSREGLGFATEGLNMLNQSGHTTEPVPMLKFARGGEVVEEVEDIDSTYTSSGAGFEPEGGIGTQFDALYKDTVGKKYPEQSMDEEIIRRAKKYMQMGGIESAEAAYSLAEQEYMEEIMSQYPNLSSNIGLAQGGEVIEESETLMAGGPYGSGRDTQDAFNVWNNMGIEDKSLFEGFLDFYKNGSWRDQIMGQVDVSDEMISTMAGRRVPQENTMMASAPSLEDSLNEKSLMVFRKPYQELTEEEVELLNDSNSMAQGGIMNRNLLNTGMDKDMRSGGFVPEGTKEKADDVPARLSKNEFVMTADAVRAAGGGSVNKGAQRMYNIMNQLEAKA